MLIDPAPTEFPIQRAFRYEVGGGLLALDDCASNDIGDVDEAMLYFVGLFRYVTH